MTPEERAKHPVQHPDRDEIHAGAIAGLTLEQTADKAGGTAARAWHMARKHKLLDRYRANAAAQSVPMFRPGEIAPAQVVPGTAAQREAARSAPQPVKSEAPGQPHPLVRLVTTLETMNAGETITDFPERLIASNLRRLIQEQVDIETGRMGARWAELLTERDQRIEALTRQVNQLAADNVALAGMLAEHRHMIGGAWTSTERYARDPVERGVAS
jgi:hypothetical protein